VLRTAIIDVDGTLVDTNYHHALTWYRAFRQHGVTVPLWRIHRSVGMGGDQLVAAVAGDEVERDLGDDLRAAEGALFMDVIDQIAPLPEARALLEQLHERGQPVVLASSAKAAEVEYYLDLLDARELAGAWTTAADAEATKPAPDLIDIALERAEGDGEGVMLGDSTWDCEAARRAGLTTLAVLTGGFGADELREAGAEEVYPSLVELRANLDETALGSGP
jgi:phosphoglycolate phosphatase-like HAD superfamily hydrolase